MQVAYHWSRAQFVRASLYDYELGPNSRRRKVVTAVVIIAILGTLALNYAHRGFAQSDLVLVAVGLLWYAMRGKLLAWSFRRAFDRAQNTPMALQFDLTEDELVTHVNDQTQRMSWSQLKRVIRTPEGFLLYPGPIWLPVAHLQEEASAEQLAALLQRKVDDYQDRQHHKLKLKDDD